MVQFRRPTRVFCVVLSALFVTACTSAGEMSASSTHKTIRNDRGGSVVHYALTTQRLKEERRFVRFSGRCASACTLYLSLPSDLTCIGPGAHFAFHLPYSSPDNPHQETARFMISSYPEWVRTWIASQGGLSKHIKVMGYDYASQYIRPCQTRT